MSDSRRSKVQPLQTHVTLGYLTFVNFMIYSHTAPDHDATTIVPHCLFYILLKQFAQPTSYQSWKCYSMFKYEISCFAVDDQKIKGLS
jgi:hypothetical protein